MILGPVIVRDWIISLESDSTKIIVSDFNFKNKINTMWSILLAKIPK